jgi:hypothetical protein
MMTKPAASASSSAWEAIENERKRDRTLRRVTVTAWTITVILVILMGVMVGTQVVQMARGALLGALPWMSVIGIAMPLVIVLGVLSVLVATLSTIGMFLRQRTASLTEIQLRLAALEGMLAQGDTTGTSAR